MRFFLKNRVHVIFSAILAFSFITSQANEVFSLSTTKYIFTSSGAIRYNNSSLLARPLHVEGNQIKNDLGEIVYLGGWQKGRFGDTLEPHWGGYKQYKQSFVDMTLQTMKDNGANVFRWLFIAYSWITNINVTTETGTMKYRDVINDLLTRAENKGLYVILLPLTIYPKECPIHGVDSPDHYRDNMGFDPYTSPGHQGVITSQTAFANFWADIVDVLGSHQNLIIQIWSEPFAGGDWANQEHLDIWQSAWQQVVNAIRAKETAKGYVKHLIGIQYASQLAYWGNISEPWKNFNWYWTNPITDPADNLFYSLHAYRQRGTVGADQPSDYATIKQIYTEENVYKLSRIEPVVITEIGAYIPADGDNGEYLFFQNSLRIFNEWGISYIVHWWRSAGGSHDQLEPGTENTNPTLNKYGLLTKAAISERS